MNNALVGYRRLEDEEDADAGSDAADVVGAAARDDSGGVVRLRRFAAGDPSADRSVRAMSIGAGPHVQALIDIGTAPNGDTVLVLGDLPRGLGDLLGGAGLSAGEVVTVLVPVVEAVERLHQCGVAHGSISATAVRFDDAGAATLVGFGASTLRGAGAVGDERFAAAVGADRAALGALIDRMQRLTGRDPIALSPTAALSDWVDALFDWADPAPLGTGRADVARRAPGIPGRVIPAAALPLDDPEPDPAPTGAPPTRASLAPAIARVRALASPAWSGLRQIRARVWAVAGVSVLALVAAIVLLPGHGTDAEPQSVAAAPSGPTRPTKTVDARATSTPVSTSALTNAAEPAAAFAALVRMRQRCITAGNVACLATTDAVDSPIRSQDETSVRSGVDPVLVPTTKAVLLARTGSTATMGVGSVTALIMYSRGTWSFRDITARSATGTH